MGKKTLSKKTKKIDTTYNSTKERIDTMIKWYKKLDKKTQINLLVVFILGIVVVMWLILWLFVLLTGDEGSDTSCYGCSKRFLDGLTASNNNDSTAEGSGSGGF